MICPTIIVKTRAKLLNLVRQEIKKYGPSCDLNHLDVSGVDNMRELFKHSEFNGDISQWAVENVTDMSEMFYGSKFNSDISAWDVSKVESMRRIFDACAFNGDISQWNVSSVTTMERMFMNSKFNSDISNWNVSSAWQMSWMFAGSAFDGNLSKWIPARALHNGNIESIFEGAAYSGNLSHWTLNNASTTTKAFGSMFRGILPVSKEPISKAFYNGLFGGAQQLNIYLRTTPFGGAHFDILRLSNSKPIWAQPEDYRWARGLSKMGETLGMSDNALRTYGLERYAVRDAINKTNQDAYSVLQNL